MTIAPRGNPLLGVELHSNSIRFVKVEQVKGQLLPRSAVIELAPDLYQDGQVLNRKAFNQAIRAGLRQQLGSYPSRAAVSLGPQTVLVRRIGLPKLRGTALRHLVETQGEQWIPFLREGAAFDLVVADPNLSEFQQEVLLVAVPTRTVRSIYDVVSAAGLKLAALDVDTSALYRAAVAAGAAPPGGVVGVIDLTADRPRLGLFQNGFLVGARSLDSRGLRGATQWGQAGLPDEFPTDARRTLDLMLTQIRSEAALNAVVVMGSPPVELMEALDREFQVAMGGRVAPDFRLTLGTGPNLPAETTVGYGLAMAHMVYPRAFKLLPRPTVLEQRQRTLAWLLAGVLAAGLGGYGFLWSLQMPLLADKESSLRSELGRQKAYLAREPEIKKAEQRAAQLDPILGALSVTDPWTIAYPRLKEILPPGVRIVSVTGNLPTLSIVGTAPAPEQVAELLNAMEKSPYFRTPILLTSGTTTEVPFNMSVDLAPREVKAK